MTGRSVRIGSSSDRTSGLPRGGRTDTKPPHRHLGARAATRRRVEWAVRPAAGSCHASPVPPSAAPHPGLLLAGTRSSCLPRSSTALLARDVRDRAPGDLGARQLGHTVLMSNAITLEMTSAFISGPSTLTVPARPQLKVARNCGVSRFGAGYAT
jgi:hypothetical protein